MSCTIVQRANRQGVAQGPSSKPCARGSSLLGRTLGWLATLGLCAALACCHEVPGPRSRLATAHAPPASAGVGSSSAADAPESSARAEPLGSSPTAAADGPLPEPHAGSVPPPAQASPGGERVEIIERAMGTRVTLVAFTTSTRNASMVREALGRGLEEIRRIEGLMSPRREDSELWRINAAAGKGPVVVGPDTLLVLQKSLRFSELSEGCFDVTFASMGPLWRFDDNAPPSIPTAAQVQQARRWIDYRKVKLDGAQRTVSLASEHTRIGLGGIAKGYAVDRAAHVLRDAGLSAFFVQAGGDLYVAGRKPSGESWRVGVRDPRGPAEATFASLEVEDHAFSTAGDYERSFVQGGRRYHHIIDPRTGYPATASRSVSIWAPDAFTADAVDDSVFILGPRKGLRLVESIDDCGAVIVDAKNKVWVSKRLKDKLADLRPPTDGI